ncbi:hypothetical protein RJ639_003823 [Escallonia herrerae]|uniref:GRAM domain-containing protein n=1 Tax=Escallonia herrerae TaxID=1293975 RepID=A0AA88W1U0_9ASTE|nr:hypothetical protein RJ639_003823 [Escallonia herrerae]
MTGKPEGSQPQQPAPPSPHKAGEPESAEASGLSSSAPPPSSSLPPDEDTKKWGTHIMGPPAVPTIHPDNQKAALWNAGSNQQLYHQQPYLVYSPVDKPSNNPLESVCHMFNSWSSKAETVAHNIWHNCTPLITLYFILPPSMHYIEGDPHMLFWVNFVVKTGPSVTGAAWGKINVTAKAITEGGFESLYKQIFATEPNEKLKKTFACYLSTTTGPVAGTLYLSTARVAFCSDRPLSFRAPSGQEAWSYYKVMIPFPNVGAINPVNMRENPSEKYIQIVTIDGHNFWFMGFVNFEKALDHLLNSLSDFRAQGYTAQPVVLS